MQQILGRSTGKTPEKTKEEPRQKWNIRRRDPDAMDVDALNTDKWTEKDYALIVIRLVTSVNSAPRNEKQWRPPLHSLLCLPLPRLMRHLLLCQEE